MITGLKKCKWLQEQSGDSDGTQTFLVIKGGFVASQGPIDPSQQFGGNRTFVWQHGQQRE